MVFFAIFVAALPAATLLAIAIASRRQSHQPVGTVIAEYAPLPGSSLLFDAVLANADARALPAALVDLAIRKKIRLLSPHDEPGAKPAKRGREQLAIELAPGAQFTAQEQRVLAVFLGEVAPDRAVRKLATKGGAAGKRAAALLADTIGELADRGLIGARPVRWPRIVCNIFGWIGVFATASVAIVCGMMLGQEATAAAGLFVAIAAFCVVIVALVLSPRPWRRFLPASLAARRHLAGMREYIRLAEADRLRVLQSPQGALRVPAAPGFERLHVYEQLLPYAMLFGLETEWAEVLRIEASSISAGDFGGDDAFAAMELVSATLQIAMVAGHLVEAMGSAGQILDAGGSVLDGIGDLLNF